MNRAARCGALAAVILAIALPALARSPRRGGDLAREFVHESWSARDGLPAANFFSVLQGTDGYLWFATDHGLVRFDGVRMTLFEPLPASPTAEEGVTALANRRDGGLWVGTTTGAVARFEDGQFTDGVRTEGTRVAAVIEERNVGLAQVQPTGRVFSYRRISRGAGTCNRFRSCRTRIR